LSPETTVVDPSPDSTPLLLTCALIAVPLPLSQTGRCSPRRCSLAAPPIVAAVSSSLPSLALPRRKENEIEKYDKLLSRERKERTTKKESTGQSQGPTGQNRSKQLGVVIKCLVRKAKMEDRPKGKKKKKSQIGLGPN
jgi:hypothetical protein